MLKYIEKHFKFVSFVPITLLSITFFIISHQEHLPQLADFTYIDKLEHLIAYFVYGLCVQIFIIANPKLFGKKEFKWKNQIIVLILGMLFGLSDEYHQSFIPGRTADVFDLLADTIGVLLSLIFYNILNKRILKLKESNGR